MTRARIGLRRGMDWSDDARLARPVDTESLIRPDVVIAEGGHLKYNTDAILVSDVIAPGLLDEFVLLADSSDDEILRFAQRRGVLSVRAFKRPNVYEEPLSDWRRVSRLAQSTLNVVAAVNRGETGASDWQALKGWWWNGWQDIARRRGDVSRLEALMGAEQQQLKDVVNRWFREAELRPYYSRQERGIVFTNLIGVDEGSLSTLGVVALQIALAASGARSLAKCSGCGMPYTRRGRDVQRGRRNYCDPCRADGVPERDAQRDKRAGKSKPRKSRGKHGKTKRPRRG